MRRWRSIFRKKQWPQLGQPPAPADVAAKAARANSFNRLHRLPSRQYHRRQHAAAPRGQRREYLERTMLDFRNGTRGNIPALSD